MRAHLLSAVAALLLLPGQQAMAADYVTIRKEVTVDRPVDAVWASIGDYCAIRDWMGTTCDATATNGGVGTVRVIANGTITEPMVAATSHSYTYWQTIGPLAAANLHGTLAAEGLGPNRTRLSYTLFYDQSALPSDAVRASEHSRLDGRFLELLGTMRALAEGKEGQR